LVNIIQQYVKKGSNVFIEGQLQTRKWEDKDGIEKYTTEVVLQGFNSTFKMLDNRNSGSVDNNFSQDNAISDSSNFDSEIDDDIPF
jgi:single-strand DNA-binding protein